jgi:hypothetical protein
LILIEPRFAEQVPAPRLERGISARSGRLNRFRKQWRGLSVLQLRVDLPKLQEQLRFIIRMAQGTRGRKAFVRRMEGRIDIPNLKVEARKIEGDGAKF